MEPPAPTLEPQPATPKPPAACLAARLLNVFAIPGDVFDEVRLSPPTAANWLAPVGVLIAASWAGAWLLFSNPAIQHQVSEMTQKAIEKQIETAHLPKEQAEQARQAGEKWGGVGTKITAFTAPVFAGFFTPFFWGLIFWLVGAKALKGNFAYLKAVEVAGLANIIAALEALVKTLLILITGNLFAAPSLMLAVKDFDPENTLHSLLAQVNLMTCWLLGVRSIGLARLSGISFARAAAWVFGIWAAYTGLFTGFGLAMRAVFGRLSGATT